VARCFVIQPFDGGKFDNRYDDVLKPAIQTTGLEAYRVDRDPKVSVPNATRMSARYGRVARRVPLLARPAVLPVGHFHRYPPHRDPLFGIKRPFSFPMKQRLQAAGSLLLET